MKLIIDIPEEMYDDIKHGYICSEYADALIQLIPSSKPYDTSGDLISREALIEAITSETRNEFEFICLSRLFEIIDNAPTVEGEILAKLKSDSAVDIDGFGVNGY